MKQLVIASNNPGKLREFQRMLAPFGIEVLTQSQLGIGEAEEPHCTFIENALAKARHVSAASGLPALADDSGICVEALHGAPGVQSARYAGDNRGCNTLLPAGRRPVGAPLLLRNDPSALAEPADCGSSRNAASLPSSEVSRELARRQADRKNNEKLLKEMQGVADRRAHYYCVLVLLHSADDPQPLIAEGEWHGEIGHEERGDGGFGYDPLFWLPHEGKMAAELSHEEKAQVSHRAKALRVLLQRLQPA
jgi:XTP/dITP diphosphohydrolase